MTIQGLDKNKQESIVVPLKMWCSTPTDGRDVKRVRTMDLSTSYKCKLEILGAIYLVHWLLTLR